MKSKKLLFPLLMSLIMMAMCPTSMWAQVCKHTSTGVCSKCGKEVAYCGDDANAAGLANAIHWELVKNSSSDTYTLEVSGTGDMKNYPCDASTNYVITTPWYINSSVRNKVNAINVGSGITRLGNYAFYNFYYATSVSIPEGVVSVGEKALSSIGFYNTMENLMLPASLKTIEKKGLSWIKVKKIIFASGSQLETIGNTSFENCFVHSITFTGATKPSIAFDAFLDADVSVIYPSTWGDIEDKYGAYFITWMKDGQLSAVDKPTELTLGADAVSAAMTVGSYKYYSFTPTECGVCDFKVERSNDNIYIVSIYDDPAFTSYLYKKEEEANSTTVWEMVKGKTYYYKVSSYRENSLSISITFRVSHNYGSDGICTGCGFTPPLTAEKASELGLSADYIGYYEIHNAGQLAWFRDWVNTSEVNGGTTTYPNQSAKAVLTADIDLSTLDGNWIPIGTEAGPFMGTFDGRGHSITGLSILNYTTGNQGLFGTTGEGSNIKHFTLSGEMTSSTSGLSNIGAVVASAGYKTGISDVTSNVNITLTEGTTQIYIAGIAGGRTSRTTLTRCVNNGNINAGASVQCIAGMMSFAGGYGSTNYCLNTGNITTTGNNAYIAGMVAYQNDGSSRFNGAHQCLNTGIITAGSDKYAGAIYGWYRHHANQVGNDNYYLETSATKAVGQNTTEDDLTGVCTSLTAEQVRWGKACYLLNVSKSTGTLFWYQTLDSDDTPGLKADGNNIVYQVNCTYCDGATGGETYSNTNQSVSGKHYFEDNDAEHTVCTKCNHSWMYYSATSQVDPKDVFYDNNGIRLSYTNLFRPDWNVGMLEFDGLPTSIGIQAFKDCSNLTKVIIPNSVVSIGSQAFKDCSNLTKVSIPNSVMSVEVEAFTGCSSLPVVNNIRYADTYLVEATNKELARYTIKEGTRFIGSSAFYCCENLANVTIPNSVISLGRIAFCGCSSLTNVTIPNAVSSFDLRVFWRCSNLTSVKFKSIPQIGIYSFDGVKDGCQYTLDLSDDSYVAADKGEFPTLTSATYSRKMSTQWGTIVLPFAVAYDNSKPYDFYEVDGVSGDVLSLKKVKTDLAAGTPVLVRMSEASKSGDTYTLSLAAANTSVSTALKSGSSANGHTLTGAYAKKVLTTESGYIINNNAFWNLEALHRDYPSSEISIGAFRAYLAGTLSSGAAQLRISAEEATALDVLNSLSTGEGWGEAYDLNGRKLNDLQQGVNIIKKGGKTYKVIVK